MSLIKFEQVTKTYHMGETQIDALAAVDLAIQAGELTAIIGASGSGKSTMMNIIGLLDRPTSGRYILDGQPIEMMSDDDMAAVRNRKIGFVFQSFFLLPKLTALQNVCLPLLYQKMPRQLAAKQALAQLAQVGMQSHGQHKPSQLSGGQQQRVAIARALVTSPSVILADEPTGALDSKTSDEVISLFKQLNQQQKVTLVIVTHDATVAAQCHRQIQVSDGQIVDDRRVSSHADI